MKKWISSIVVGLVLGACNSINTGNNKSHYQLPSSMRLLTKTTKSHLTTQNNQLLWVEQVVLPDFLAGNGFVYQTSDVQYVITSNNLWASPLDQQLKNMLITNLSNLLSGWLVTSKPLKNNQDTLNVNVTGFHGRYDGKVIVSGDWLLNHHGQLIKNSFYLELKQYKNGYEDMVKTLARAWEQEIRHIAANISRLS